LVVAQLLLSWIALERLPTTVVPYFHLGGLTATAPDASAEARLWTWTVLALWTVMVTGSVALYRLLGASPVPIVSVGLLTFLALLRAGVIALNLSPHLSPQRVLLRAAATGVVAAILAGLLERWRSRQRLAPLLVEESSYDEPTPRPWSYNLICVLGLGLPWLLLPTRLRMTSPGLVAVTPVTYFLVPREAVRQAESITRVQALLGQGVNLASDYDSALRIWRHRRLFPLVISAKGRDQLVALLEQKKSHKG
jgi:hypothetical protein